MRRLSTPTLVLSLVGALCVIALAVAWLVRDEGGVDVAPLPLGFAADAYAAGRAAPTAGEDALLASRSESPLVERRALATSDQRALLELHPERSQLDFVVSAAGAPAADAVIVLFGSRELALPLFVAAPGLTVTEGGGVVTGLDGRASVAVAPKVEWRGIVRWTPPATAAPLSAEFRAVSPIAGYPREVAIDLGSIQASRFLHIEVCSAPSGVELGGAELLAIMDDGSPAPSELGPTRAVSDADGRALLWWPIGARLCVEAAGHTPLMLFSAHLDRIRAGVVHTTLEAAAAAAPTALELSALGALHGRLDPSWAAGGRIFVDGPTGGSFGGRQLRGGAHESTDRERTATVTATGHWRIDGLPTHIPPDPARAFATDPRGGLVVRFEGADSGDAPRVVRATVAVDVLLEAGADFELPDPFGACAPVALTARGPEGLVLDGVRVELHLLRSINGEDAGLEEARRARRLRSRQMGMTVADELVAEGVGTATGRVLAPDLPLGHYELRVPHLASVEGRSPDLALEPDVPDSGGVELDVSERFCRAWGRFEHDGRPVELSLTSGQPEEDERPGSVRIRRGPLKVHPTPGNDPDD